MFALAAWCGDVQHGAADVRISDEVFGYIAHLWEVRMGARFRFACSKCEYEVNVAGGISVGLDEGRNTMVCNGCKTLVDVLIRDLRDRDEQTEKPFTCPACGSAEVEQWARARPCPRCGKEMRQARGKVLWD